MSIFTIGHSTQTINEFLELLKKHRVDVIADVRSSPFSQKFPHFSKDQLELALKAEGIKYVFLGNELGARRKEPECYVGRKADYKCIAELPAFEVGIARLLAGSKTYRIAIMCAEQDPLTCHRTILICRHLKNRSVILGHILRGGRIETHEDAELRLTLEEGENLNQTDMFRVAAPLDSALERAYTKRGDRIAYQDGIENEDLHDWFHQKKR